MGGSLPLLLHLAIPSSTAAGGQGAGVWLWDALDTDVTAHPVTTHQITCTAVSLHSSANHEL